jgi:hypothetical protein
MAGSVRVAFVPSLPAEEGDALVMVGVLLRGDAEHS